ncbi:guanylate kinase [Schizopora paradoxa]|uniref:Guanylate kinase n=1 Tax=Schizopora paradoxa TaxID=27342 RepID=A0A0H2RLD5_9AGAM|nr:guanylate kinase [Schizopora paradoxa]
MSLFSRPLVVSGPSGVGKSTLLKRLFADFPDKFGFSVSHTTRSPRPGEVDGKDYHFVSRDDFLDLLKSDGFIEHAEFSRNLYGTSRRAVEKVHAEGRRCILDIEAQGVRQIKKTDLNPVYVFISPPSMQSLKERLVGRATDSEEQVQKRLLTAIEEMRYAHTGAHDIILVNDSLDQTYDKFKRVAIGNGDVESDVLPNLSPDSSNENDGTRTPNDLPTHV